MLSLYAEYLHDKTLRVMIGDNPTQPALQNTKVTEYELRDLKNQTNHLAT